MRNAHPSRPKFAALLVLLLTAAGAGQAMANVGRVEFVSGDVTAVSATGQSHALMRGEQLSQGDTIHTNAGRAQIRFADGAYVSLQPGTEFGIKEYNFDGKADGTERGFFALLKGAMRAVTGLIGHVDHSKYRISTPTATVGIRGTGGLIQVLNDGATLIRGSSGIWVLSSPAGSVEVPAGTSAIAPANPNIPPHETSEGPSLPPPPPVGGLNNDFRQGDQVKPDGTPASLSIASITPPPPPTQLPSGRGYAAAVAFSDPNIDSNLQGVLSSGSPATAVFDATGALTHVNFKDPAMQAESVFNLNPDGKQVQGESGNDGIIAWGRWTGGVNINCGASACPLQPTYTDNQGLHYVVGLPTPVLPTTGTATYTLTGATSPTYVDGHTSPGTFTGTLDVGFTAAGANVGMNFNVAMPDASYALTGNTTTTSSQFGAGTDLKTLSVTGGNCASGGCSSNVQGFFAGPTAERAGVAYQITDGSTQQQILGAAAFKK
ncbi:MAG TPA: FecR family protein [Burkholderiales bacterium]|nr:FecR family protein [Burkholderiales bacterium]HYA46717.1 FecR family protein [Burkholderiales bacterium]